MPLGGTFDVWVLFGITAINLFAAAFGIARLKREGAFTSFGGGSENILWLGVVFAFVDAARPATGSSCSFSVCIDGLLAVRDRPLCCYARS